MSKLGSSFRHHLCLFYWDFSSYALLFIGIGLTAGRTDDRRTTLTTAPTMWRCMCGRAWVLGPCSSKHCLMLEPIAAVPRPDTLEWSGATPGGRSLFLERWGMVIGPRALAVNAEWCRRHAYQVCALRMTGSAPRRC
jgi:hypothetical protein